MSSFITYNKEGGRVKSVSFNPHVNDLSPYEDENTSAMFVSEEIDIFNSKVVNGKVLPILDTDFPEETLKTVKREIKETSFAGLVKSDWTQLADTSLSAEKVEEWKAYRKLLRDMSKIPDSDLVNVKRAKDLDWPLYP
jgi:hypothetical protein